MSAIGSCSQILGALFLQDPRADAAWKLFEGLAITTSSMDWPFGDEDGRSQAWSLLQEGLSATKETYAFGTDGTREMREDTVPFGSVTVRESLAREYQRLFVGPHHFEAPAWGSVYLDKDRALFGCSTLELRQWMRTNGIALNDDKAEPEDHIGKMLVLLGWLANEKPGLVPEYLCKHLMTWAPRYLELLITDARNSYYRGLALLTDITLADITKSLGLTPTKRKLYY